MPVKTRTLAFTDQEIELLHMLCGMSIRRVFTDGVTETVFDGSTRCIVAKTLDIPAASVNKYDEAIVVRPELRDPAPELRTGDRVLVENSVVEEILLVRTLLWFTPNRAFSSPEDAVRGLPAPKSHTERKVHEVLRRTARGHQERVTHPSAPHLIESEVANLVDAGFVVRTGKAFISCFSPENAFSQSRGLLTEQDLDQLGDSYEVASLGVAV